MSAKHKNVKVSDLRLFDPVPGAASARATLAEDGRISWPLIEWLGNLGSNSFDILPVHHCCLLMLTEQDYMNSYIRLIDSLHDGSIRQQALAISPVKLEIRIPPEARGPLRLSPEDRNGSRLRITIPVVLESAAHTIFEKRQLKIAAKRRWAEVWVESEWEEWHKKLVSNKLDGAPLPPPPFTPDILEAYIRYQAVLRKLRRPP